MMTLTANILNRKKNFRSPMKSKSQVRKWLEENKIDIIKFKNGHKIAISLEIGYKNKIFMTFIGGKFE